MRSRICSKNGDKLYLGTIESQVDRDAKDTKVKRCAISLSIEDNAKQRRTCNKNGKWEGQLDRTHHIGVLGCDFDLHPIASVHANFFKTAG